MKWRTLYYAACLILAASLAACSTSDKGSTAVTFTISSGSGAHKPGTGPRSKAMNPVTSVRITISGPGMDTMTNSIPVTPPQTVSQLFYVLNGPRRTFLIEALDALDGVVYSGSSTADLNGTPVTISLPLQTLLFNNLITTPWNDEARTIAQAQDGSGLFIIAGHTFGDLGGPNADPTHATPDIFVSKLTATGGGTLWTRQFGTNTFDICYSAGTDSAGNIYLTGSTGGSLGIAKSGFIDAYVMKLDPAGTVLWTTQTGTPLATTFGNALTVDNAGNVYITGQTTGDLAGNGNAGGNDILLAKYDSTGVLQWIQQQGTTEDDYGNGIALDAGGTNVYITGATHGGLLSSLTGSSFANAGPNTTTDMFLSKYDSGTGSWQWTTQSGSGDNDDAWGVVVDLTGDIYITGGTTGNLVTSLTGSTDLFLVKYEPINGTVLWAQQLGAIGSNTVANAIAVYPNAGVVVTGTTDGDLDQLGNAGLNDMFMVEYDQNGYPGNLQQFGTKANDDGAGIVIDNTGTMTIVGNTYGGFTSLATEDIFLQQYTWVAPLVP